MLRARLHEEPEGEARFVHDFAGRRCTDVVIAVVAQLRAQGVIRDQ
jgi:hypothetical protein